MILRCLYYQKQRPRVLSEREVVVVTGSGFFSDVESSMQETVRTGNVHLPRLLHLNGKLAYVRLGMQ